MPSKVQLYAQMADRTAEQITGSYQKWTAFLTTAARLYKYPYNEQLMIFAQRPEATACAGYDLWNKQMRRYVRRGSKGHRPCGYQQRPTQTPICIRCFRYQRRRELSPPLSLGIPAGAS